MGGGRGHLQLVGRHDVCSLPDTLERSKDLHRQQTCVSAARASSESARQGKGDAERDADSRQREEEGIEGVKPLKTESMTGSNACCLEEAGKDGRDNQGALRFRGTELT